MTIKTSVSAKIYKVKAPYSNQPISISGPSAVGKSTITRLIAQKLSVPLYDLDDEVCKKAGFKTTQEVIQTLGHDQFKIIQNQCLREISQNTTEKYVLAAGGEILRNGYNQDIINDNRALLAKYTYNICLFPSDDLDESVSILFPRLHDGKRDVKTTGETIPKFKQYIDVFPQYADLAAAIILTHKGSKEEVFATVLKVLSHKT